MSDDIFTADQRQLLASVLDGIIPPSASGMLPGAGDLGLVDFIENVIRENPETKPAIEQGLATIDEFARQRTQHPLSVLPPSRRHEVLTEHGETAPAFVPTLMFHLYVGYYQHPQVIEALGVPPRPPHPQGYDVAPADLSLLEPVRKRGKAYRDA